MVPSKCCTMLMLYLVLSHHPKHNISGRSNNKMTYKAQHRVDFGPNTAITCLERRSLTRPRPSDTSSFCPVARGTVSHHIPQDGTPLADKMFGAAILPDDSVVISGYSEGDWAQTNAGGSDFCAARLGADGTEIWRWQVRTRFVWYI